MNDNKCTVYVGNIDEKVTEDLLYELFLQVGPLNGVCIPKDHKTGGKRNFAFVKFTHEESVDYSLTMLEDVQLFGRRLNLRRKSGPQSKPEESVYQSTPNSSTPSDARIEAEKMRREAIMMNNSHQDYNNQVDYQHHHQQMYYNDRKNDDYYNSSSNYRHHRKHEMKHGGDHNGGESRGKGYHHNNSDTPMQQRSLSRNQDSPLWIRDGSVDDTRMPHRNGGGGRQHHMMAADGRHLQSSMGNHGSPLAGRSPVWQGSDSYNHGSGRRMAHQQQHNSPYAQDMYHRRHHPYSSPRFNR